MSRGIVWVQSAVWRHDGCEVINGLILALDEALSVIFDDVILGRCIDSLNVGVFGHGGVLRWIVWPVWPSEGTAGHQEESQEHAICVHGEILPPKRLGS